MEKVTFKSNIKCAGCIEKVSPVLNAEPMVENWEVNILTPEKIVSIYTNETDTEKLIEVLEKALASVGYKIEKV